MLNLLIDPSQLLELERQLTGHIPAPVTNCAVRRRFLYLTVISPAQGDFSQSDHERNTSIIESNTRREYRFDALNGRLLGARVTLLAEEGGSGRCSKSTASRTTLRSILPPLTVLPEGINWTDQTRNTPSPRLTGIDAKEAARLILAAFATWDNEILDEALRSYGAHARKLLQSRYAGATVERLSEPVRSGKYPGWFIPCTLRMGRRKPRKGSAWPCATTTPQEVGSSTAVSDPCRPQRAQKPGHSKTSVPVFIYLSAVG